MSATGAAFLTKQVPNVGFPGASKAVQSSQTNPQVPKTEHFLRGIENQVSCPACAPWRGERCRNLCVRLPLAPLVLQRGKTRPGEGLPQPLILLLLWHR